MSLIKTNRTAAGAAAIGERAKDAAAQAVPMGKRAGTTVVRGARQGAANAKEWAAPRVQDAAPRVQDAVRGVREWAAPRLEGAADAVTTSVAPKIAAAVTTSVAPKVSSALRSTASQVRPAGSTRKGLRRLLDWRWLLGLGAVVTVAGATAAVAMRRRYASATAEAENAVEPDAAEPDGDFTAAAETAARAQVNGQVTTPKS